MDFSQRQPLGLQKPTVEQAIEMLKDLYPDDISAKADATWVLQEAGWTNEQIEVLIPKDSSPRGQID